LTTDTAPVPDARLEMRYHLIFYGLLMFLGGSASVLYGDRGGKIEHLVPMIISLGGLGVIVGMATCDVVDVINERGKDKSP